MYINRSRQAILRSLLLPLPRPSSLDLCNISSSLILPCDLSSSNAKIPLHYSSSFIYYGPRVIKSDPELRILFIRIDRLPQAPNPHPTQSTANSHPRRLSARQRPEDRIRLWQVQDAHRREGQCTVMGQSDLAVLWRRLVSDCYTGIQRRLWEGCALQHCVRRIAGLLEAVPCSPRLTYAVART